MSFYSDEVEFLSIVVPTYNRFHYLRDLVNSIHAHADFPFELIVHDDNSDDGARDEATSFIKDKVSTLILDYGPQLGLSESINRCIKVCGSRYILMLNSDMLLHGPALKDIVNIIKNKFVGILFPTTPSVNKDMMTNGSKFVISNEFGGGCAMAFRREVYDEVGAFDTVDVCSGNADVSFITRVYKAGYFPAKPCWPSKYIRNTSQEEVNSSDTTIKGVGGCNLPKIFNIPKPFYDSKNQHRHHLCDQRQNAAWKQDMGACNIQQWGKHIEEVVRPDGSINWEAGSIYGQTKWKEEIERLRAV